MGRGRVGAQHAAPLRFFPVPPIPLNPASLAPMSLRLSEHPERDRPRERLWSVGPGALTGQELLAILLGTGCAGRDALAVAGELLARVDGSLRRLAGRPSADLARVPGVGRGKAARVVAALELGRRVGAEEEPPPERIRGPADVRSEEHTSELQSQSNLVCRLLLEKKKKRTGPGRVWTPHRTALHPLLFTGDARTRNGPQPRPACARRYRRAPNRLFMHREPSVP